MSATLFDAAVFHAKQRTEWLAYAAGAMAGHPDRRRGRRWAREHEDCVVRIADLVAHNAPIAAQENANGRP